MSGRARRTRDAATGRVEIGRHPGARLRRHRTFEIHAMPHSGGGLLEDRAEGPGPIDPDPPYREAAPSQPSAAEQIRRDILTIHRDSYGRGADVTQAYVLDDTVIVILDGLELLPNEEFLIERDHGDAVKAVREQFQQAIRPTFAAAVERATGRRVVGFASHAELDQGRFAVEIF